MKSVMRSVPPGHEHHPERRAEDEEVILARPGALDFEVAHAHQHRERRRNEEHDLEKQREGVDGNEPARNLDVGVGHRDERNRRGGEHGQRDPGENRLLVARDEKVRKQQ